MLNHLLGPGPVLTSAFFLTLEVNGLKTGFKEIKPDYSIDKLFLGGLMFLVDMFCIGTKMFQRGFLTNC